MSKRYWLSCLVASLAWFNTGVVWLIQFSCYPLWPYVGRDQFLNYHNAWWQGTWWVVFVPSALVAAGSVLMPRFAPSGIPRWALWTGVAIRLSCSL